MTCHYLTCLTRFEDFICLSDALRAEGQLLEKAAAGIWRGVPLHRRRGDPVDVSPYATPVGDLQAVWRWLCEWQC